MDYSNFLPRSNRTVEIMAAVFNRLVEVSTTVLAVPNRAQCSDPHDEPPYITTFSLLEITELTIERAVEVDKIIHDRVLVAKWGDYRDDDTRTLRYRWKCLAQRGCTLLTKKEGDEQFRVLHAVLYYADSDVDLILNFSKNPFHRRKYAELGIQLCQMELATYDWISSGPREPQWTLRDSHPLQSLG